MILDLISKINNELKNIFESNNFDSSFAYISISNRPDLADYQINSCFNIAKKLGKNPFDVAVSISELVKDLKIDGAKVFSFCEACKPGFVNLKLVDDVLVSHIKASIFSDNLGIPNLSEYEKDCCCLYGNARVPCIHAVSVGRDASGGFVGRLPIGWLADYEGGSVCLYRGNGNSIGLLCAKGPGA